MGNRKEYRNARDKQLAKLVESFKRILLKGYSDDNYTKLARIYNQMSGHLSAEQFESIGEMWRCTYDGSLAAEDVAKLLTSFKQKLQDKEQ